MVTAVSTLAIATLALLMAGATSASAADSISGGGLTAVVSLANTGMDLPRWLLLAGFILITGVGLLIVARLVIPKRNQRAKPLD
jgi:LPXTG-motif cell wall-anchored protein